MPTLSFDADDEELALFLAENNDHLQSLDQNIVRLETEPDDQALLQSIFRSAHTIKGGAGMIGHGRMNKLAHAMENILDGLRAGALRVTPEIVDALLGALDALRVLNDEVITREESDIALDGVLAALAACLSPTPTGSAPAVAPSPPDETAAAPTAPRAPSAWEHALAAWEPDDELRAALTAAPRDHVYTVTVSVDPDCGLAAARTLQSYLELGRAARVLRVTPRPDEMEREEEIYGYTALVVTDELPSLLETKLGRTTDVIDASVEAVGLPGEAATEAPRPVVDDIASAGSEPALADTDSASDGEEPAPQDTAAPQATAPVPTATAPARPSPAVAPRVAEKAAPEMIRISVGIVDDLMNLASELVLGRTRLGTLRQRLQEAYPNDETVAALADAVARLDGVGADLQATVMKARMLPVENVFNKFPRLVRDLATQSGKRVTFTMSGQDTELDRSVIEQLSDPLVHLLRNAIDHGIESPEDRRAAGKSETGAISLSAAPQENHILIKVQDDGGGIDGEKVKASAVKKGFITPEAAAALSPRDAVELVFAPGLSTARAITDISGRGVGMDIVKATLERMGGHVAIESVVGQGTTFLITLPLTLAIMQALLVSVDDAVYALPLTTVTEILTIPVEAIQNLQGTEVTVVRGVVLPIVRLRDYYGRRPAPPAPYCHVVATRIDGQPLGLMVDAFIGEQEIVMKPLGASLGPLPGLAGATILGDGRIGLLVDVAALKEGRPTLAA